MKSASLLIDMNFIGQAETLRTQWRIIFPLPLRGRQWKSTQQLTLHKLQKASILGCKVPRRAVYYPKGRVVLLFGVPALWNACPVKCEAYFSGAKPIPLGSAKSKKSKSSALSVSPARRAVKKRCTQSGVLLVPDSFLWLDGHGRLQEISTLSANCQKKQEKKLDNLNHNK